MHGGFSPQKLAAMRAPHPWNFEMTRRYCASAMHDCTASVTYSAQRALTTFHSLASDLQIKNAINVILIPVVVNPSHANSFTLPAHCALEPNHLRTVEIFW